LYIMKALGLFSGGLDSALSARMMKEFGLDVHVVYCCQPWQEADLDKIQCIAEGVGAAFHVMNFGQDYFDMLLNPRHGYGKAFNPCIDCHRFMVRKAAGLMREIGAEFVFTGEVVGQRPMSQRKACLPLIEQETGLEGYLLRPLSARLLDPTLPEKNGWVDRRRFLALSGRGRRTQLALAKTYGIKDFLQPAGGCLLTDAHFGKCLKDFLSWDYHDPRESAAVKWGRYFRINDDFIAIVGRDKRENELLISHAYPEDHIIRMAEASGPFALLKGKNPGEEILSAAGGLVQRFSKSRNKKEERIFYESVSDTGRKGHVTAVRVSDQDLKKMER